MIEDRTDIIKGVLEGTISEDVLTQEDVVEMQRLVMQAIVEHLADQSSFVFEGQDKRVLH